MKKSIIYLSIALFSWSALKAEETTKWTLQECIDYALERNIQLKQNILSLQESEVNVSQAKGALFPNLFFSSNQNVVNRPFQENGNIISGNEVINSSTKTTYNSTYGISANWLVWNGNKRNNNIKQQEINSKISSLAVKETTNLLTEQIVQSFIQIIYAEESININRNTLEVSKAQYNRAQELLKEGSLSKADVAQLAAQVSADQYQLVTAESTLQNYKLQLKQLLEIEDDSPMELAIPELNTSKIVAPLPSKSNIYEIALASRPEIESEMLGIKNADLSIAIAKAGYYPSINLNASSSSNYVNSYDGSWGNQLKKGWNNTIGFNISIPIFDNRETSSAVKKAKIQKENSELNLSDNKKTLYKAIEKLWLDAHNAQQQFLSADSNLQSAEISFEMVNEQFNLGMKNIVELLTEKNNLLSAKQQRIQAKYLSILNRSLLALYANENPVSIIENN